MWAITVEPPYIAQVWGVLPKKVPPPPYWILIDACDTGVVDFVALTIDPG